jgi:hypothetical protein
VKHDTTKLWPSVLLSTNLIASSLA